jgi:hypothetical protein
MKTILITLAMLCGVAYGQWNYLPVLLLNQENNYGYNYPGYRQKYTLLQDEFRKIDGTEMYSVYYDKDFFYSDTTGRAPFTSIGYSPAIFIPAKGTQRAIEQKKTVVQFMTGYSPKAYVANAARPHLQRLFDEGVGAVQKLNKNLKTIGRLAGLTALVRVEQRYLSGTRVRELPKWQLLSMHRGRNTFAKLSMQFDVPANVVIKVLRHSNLAQLSQYVEPDENETLDAVRKGWKGGATKGATKGQLAW